MGRYLLELARTARTMIVGMNVTIRNMVKPSITVRYPDERLDLPVGYRGIPVLLSDTEGALKCVSCELCARACPVQCIEIQSHKEPGQKIKVLDVYNLDATWCMYCGLCAEACPFDALAMSDQYELADYDLGSLVYNRDRLAEIGLRQTTETINFGIKTGGENTR